jgi:hypothetical protein
MFGKVFSYSAVEVVRCNSSKEIEINRIETFGFTIKLRTAFLVMCIPIFFLTQTRTIIDGATQRATEQLLD